MPEANAKPEHRHPAIGPSPAPGSPPQPLYGVYPALVVDREDPDGMGRVQVRLPWAHDPEGGEYQAWARLATLMAGNGRGTWFIPEIDDEVLVAFEAGDPARPFVVGALWNGRDLPPEKDVDKKVIRSRNGLQITLDDAKGAEKLVLETPEGNQVVLDDGGDEVQVQDRHGNLIRLHAGGVTITSAASVRLQASNVDVQAGMVTIDAGMARFSGVVQCSTLIANAVVSSSYTPGAGNIW